MTINRQVLITMLMTMMINWHQPARGHVTITGSVVLEQKWADFQAPEGTSQYKAVTSHIKKSIMKHFEDDPSFENMTVTQIREDHASKKSVLEGNLAAEFKLHLRNHSVTGLGRLRDTVMLGRLGDIPVKKNSLYLQGLPVSQIPINYNSWPAGSYGLPKPVTGCPGNGWQQGYRYHDTENFRNLNSKSNDSHLSGNVNGHGIRQEFCMHIDDQIKRKEVTGRAAQPTRPWPMGKYCIYKKDDECPEGLREGCVYWDDENTFLDHPNSHSGALPDGIYNRNTLIYYCCDRRGEKSTPMLLPFGHPFFLIAFESKECQKVHGFKASSEYLFFDDEDRTNHNKHSSIAPYGLKEDLYNTRIYYCYYQPGKYLHMKELTPKSSITWSEISTTSNEVPCDSEHQTDPACYAHFLASNSDDVTNMMITDEERMSRRHKAFFVGSAVGIFLMGWTFFAVTLKRLVTKRSYTYYEVVGNDNLSCSTSSWDACRTKL